jgi:hypothetical protein
MKTGCDDRTAKTAGGRFSSVRRVLRLASVVLAVAAVSFPAVATGQADAGAGDRDAEADRETSASTRVEGTSDGAQPAERPAAARETSIHGGWLVIATYLLLWLAVMVYIVHLANRQKALTREIEAIETRIDQILDGVADGE